MLLVIKRERPEAPDRWKLSLGERDGVAVGAVQPATRAVEVLVEVLRLVRFVDEDIRLPDRRTSEVVGPEHRAGVLRGPVSWQRDAPVTELQQRADEVLVC